MMTIGIGRVARADILTVLCPRKARRGSARAGSRAVPWGQPTPDQKGRAVTVQAPQVAISRNPATDTEINRYPFLEAADLDAFLDEVQAGFNEWSQVSASDRGAVLARMAELLRRDRDKTAAVITAEMGKPITQSRAEVEKCATVLDWYAENGPAMVDDSPTSIGPEAHVSYLPLGPVLAVEPWNFPFWQVMRGAIPILLGGNCYVLKPAPNVVGCAIAMSELWREAGVPAGGFSVLNADNDVVSSAIADPRIVGVTVTGSVGAGSAIAAQAGKVVKRSVLELGGADPFVVLADADLDLAVEAAVRGRFYNAGQICIAAKRIILERSIAAEFTERFVAKVKDLPVGDPAEESTYIGPIARPDLRDQIHDQVERSLSDGAELLLGGHPLPGAGNFYEPTILGGVTSTMTAFREEIFGPVATLIVADDVDHAVQLANDSEFGLSASVWTADTAAAAQLARKLQVGGVFINSIAVSDPRIPIGGMKNSGYGRELSHFGVHEFTNIQAVWTHGGDNNGETR